jgi:hypothetical protein
LTEPDSRTGIPDLEFHNPILEILADFGPGIEFADGVVELSGGWGLGWRT